MRNCHPSTGGKKERKFPPSSLFYNFAFLQSVCSFGNDSSLTFVELTFSVVSFVLFFVVLHSESTASPALSLWWIFSVWIANLYHHARSTGFFWRFRMWRASAHFLEESFSVSPCSFREEKGRETLVFATTDEWRNANKEWTWAPFVHQSPPSRRKFSPGLAALFLLFVASSNTFLHSSRFSFFIFRFSIAGEKKREVTGRRRRRRRKWKWDDRLDKSTIHRTELISSLFSFFMIDNQNAQRSGCCRSQVGHRQYWLGFNTFFLSPSFFFLSRLLIILNILLFCSFFLSSLSLSLSPCAPLFSSINQL